MSWNGKAVEGGWFQEIICGDERRNDVHSHSGHNSITFEPKTICNTGMYDQ